MEGKSAKAFEALNKITEDIRVKVIRNGNLEIINQKDWPENRSVFFYADFFLYRSFFVWYDYKDCFTK